MAKEMLAKNMKIQIWPVHNCTFIFLMLLCHQMAFEQHTNESQPPATRLNQLGYYPKATKQAVIADNHPASSLQNFTSERRSDQKIVLNGTFSARKNWELANEQVRIADFCNLEEPGMYILSVS